MKGKMFGWIRPCIGDSSSSNRLASLSKHRVSGNIYQVLTICGPSLESSTGGTSARLGTLSMHSLDLLSQDRKVSSAGNASLPSPVCMQNSARTPQTVTPDFPVLTVKGCGCETRTPSSLPTPSVG